jgi:hypothetical protein
VRKNVKKTRWKYKALTRQMMAPSLLFAYHKLLEGVSMETPTKTPSIMIVDDNDGGRLLAKLAIEDSGITDKIFFLKTAEPH